ncbi:hypothetical protein SESBI_01514 [Sesbania bispinosa]|nr:hypothetical protein SESBI_01514 [Sesbania bispinosa]
MDQQNQNNTPDGSGDVPLKPPVPPGFEGVNGNQQLQRGQENDSNDGMVGQVVYGIIEAVFDAGYLLSVRVGDSDTNLRGLVFKPGRYIPISPENDVAPGVPMIQRNDVPFPSRTTQVQTPLPKEKSEHPVNVYRIETPTVNGPPSVPQVPRGTVGSSNLVASGSSGKNVPSVAVPTTHQLVRGNMVPVLLQPNNFSNGLPVSNQLAQVAPISLGSGIIVDKDIPVDGNHTLTSHAQTSQNTLPSGMQSEGVAHYQSSSNVPIEDEAKSMRTPSAPFEHLVTEVVKRIQAPSDAMDTETDNSKSGDSTLVKDPRTRQEDKVNDMDQPVLIEPLQAVQSHLQENNASAPKPSDYTETGKMSELLQNKAENQASKAAELESGNRLDDIRNFGTELEDGGTVQSTKPF